MVPSPHTTQDPPVLGAKTDRKLDEFAGVWYWNDLKCTPWISLIFLEHTWQLQISLHRWCFSQCTLEAVGHCQSAAASIPQPGEPDQTRVARATWLVDSTNSRDAMRCSTGIVTWGAWSNARSKCVGIAKSCLNHQSLASVKPKKRCAKLVQTTQQLLGPNLRSRNNWAPRFTQDGPPSLRALQCPPEICEWIDILWYPQVILFTSNCWQFTVIFHVSPVYPILTVIDCELRWVPQVPINDHDPKTSLDETPWHWIHPSCPPLRRSSSTCSQRMAGSIQAGKPKSRSHVVFHVSGIKCMYSYYIYIYIHTHM